MRRIRRACEFPLLVKELKEMAARPRTYLIRFGYALVLFGVAYVLFYGGTGSNIAIAAGPQSTLFEQLVRFQLWGICLFLPAVTAGAITIEKEREALGLLLLTAMSPFSIVLQKFLSRLIPMLSFVLLSFPLMAVAYSYGGVTARHFWMGLEYLVVVCALVAAVSIICSVYFRSTTEALIASYIALAFGSLVFGSLLSVPAWIANTEALHVTQITRIVVASTSILLTLTVVILGMLAVSGSFLVKRAFLPPRNMLLELFKSLDKFYNDLNAVTGGVVLVNDNNVPPGDRPIAWRETRKKSLGTFRYLFRVLVALELPIVLEIIGDPDKKHAPLQYFLYALWCIAVPLIVVHAAGLFSSERSNQTLNVLLAAPITGREIILQKASGVRRHMAVLFVPFVTIYLFETWWEGHNWYEYPLFSLLTMIGTLPLAAWMAVWVGLKLRTQSRAILAALGLAVGWVLFPVAARLILTGVLHVQIPIAAQYLWCISPVDIIVAIETMKPEERMIPEPAWPCYVMYFLATAGLTLLFRSRCLSQPDRLLGRMVEFAPVSPASGVPQHADTQTQFDAPLFQQQN